MLNNFTKKQAADMLGLSTVTIDRLRKSGELPYRRFGGQVRFTNNDIEIFISRSAAGGKDDNPR